MNLHKIVIALALFINFSLHNNLYSQQFTDTIITDDSDTISCKITYVNNYSIFYNIEVNNNSKKRILPRLFVEKMIINSKNVPVLEQRFDSHINGYYKKSKLSKKYETLLLKENSNKCLKILADSTFIIKTKKIDFFNIAITVELFAKKYNCKLIYISRIVKDQLISFNVKLFDASDSLYHELMSQYKQNTICFFRGNKTTEPKEFKLKHNDTIIWLKKNEVIEFKINPEEMSNFTKDTITNNDYSKNKYFYIGDIRSYKLTPSIIASLFVSVALSSITGTFIWIEYHEYITETSNFIGEFMKILTKSQ